MVRYLKGIVVLGVMGFLAGSQVGVTAEVKARAAAVEGVSAIVRGNQAEARAQAVQDALQKALQQEVETLVDPQVREESAPQLAARLYRRTLTYIRSYRILWEYPDVAQQVYRVGVEAEVAVDDVTREVQALGFTAAGEERVRLLVLVVEDHLGRTHMNTLGGDRGVVARVLRTALQNQGFRMVSLQEGQSWDGHEGSALAVAKQVGVGVVLVGQARAQKVRSDIAGMALQAIEAEVEMRALRTTTGETVARQQAESMALHADAILGGTQALERAASEVAARLTPVLRAYQQYDQTRVVGPRGGH